MPNTFTGLSIALDRYPAGYDMPHTALTFLIDPHGKYHTHFADTIDEAGLAEKLRSEISSEKAARPENEPI